MKDSKPVGRYSLILEKEGIKYCYDFEKGSFREFDKKGPYKTKLSKIDAFTSYCDSKEQFLTLQGLEDDGKLYISYNHEGENVLRCVFDNKFWNTVALTAHDNKVDFANKDIDDKLKEIFSAICDPNSEYYRYIVENPKRTIRLSPKILECIHLAHKHSVNYEYRKKMGENTGLEYQSDFRGYYEDLRKNIRRYRDFRVLNLSYDVFTKSKEKSKQDKKEVSVKQLSMNSYLNGVQE